LAFLQILSGLKPPFGLVVRPKAVFHWRKASVPQMEGNMLMTQEPKTFDRSEILTPYEATMDHFTCQWFSLNNGDESTSFIDSNM
jgi:hypothetical protein